MIPPPGANALDSAEILRYSGAMEPRTSPDHPSFVPANALAITGTSRCLFGDNRQIRQICEVVRKVSQSSGPVLLRGESGTGKEVLATAIHAQSPRSERPFVAVNAGAIPAELVESELFGHVKGSFTGADRDRVGRFLEADGGTIFLDEIGDMPLQQQVKLLRVLQTGEIRPVGAGSSRFVDVRVVAATNRDLEKMLAEGTFREDLFFRLNLFAITIPPLRSRQDDLLSLATIFIRRFSAMQGKNILPAFRPEVEKLLIGYPWPGNIRELENAVHYAVTMADEAEIQVHDLPDQVRTCRSPFNPAGTPEIGGMFAFGSRLSTLEEVEKAYILHAYHECGHNKTKTAEVLNISLRSLQMKLKKWNVAGSS